MTVKSGLLSALGLLSCSCLLAGLAGVRLNTSLSLPLGLYVRTSDANALLVEFCPAEPFASLSRDRGYRIRGVFCPDHAVPLLKPIVARAGDIVTTSQVGITVNGRLLPNTFPLRADAKNRPLTAWPLGTYTVLPGTVWVASTYNAASFDSRYIGPVEEKAVLGRLKPLWLFHS